VQVYADAHRSFSSLVPIITQPVEKVIPAAEWRFWLPTFGVYFINGTAYAVKSDPILALVGATRTLNRTLRDFSTGCSYCLVSRAGQSRYCVIDVCKRVGHERGRISVRLMYRKDFLSPCPQSTPRPARFVNWPISCPRRPATAVAKRPRATVPPAAWPLTVTCSTRYSC
jgi:hypothetical protein